MRDAVLDATAALVEQHGLRGVTMSRVAEAAGIGRATLYRHFPDVGAVLLAWHERQVETHVAELAEVRARAGSAAERLAAVLTGYAHRSRGSRGHGDSGLAALLHGGGAVDRATGRLRGMLREIIEEGARAGDLRDDVPADELAGFCLHALAGAGGLPSEAAVQRLVGVTLAGLRPQAPGASGG
ncbi:MAG: TetR/AcrR family transcriptional regulator [Actinomycetota bacterium]|nr:TetR/AcrR family transcriptional regulator [Actinomycetota bacterium]